MNAKMIARFIRNAVLIVAFLGGLAFLAYKVTAALLPASSASSSDEAAFKAAVDAEVARLLAQQSAVAPVEALPSVAGTFDGTMNLIPSQGGSREHVVAEGENVGIIAQQYSVDPEGIIALNNLQGPDYVIYVGQTLKIPESVYSNSGSDTYTPTGPALQVRDTILGDVGYSRKTEENPDQYPWPAEWTTVARPKFEHIDGQPTWRTQAILPGETALYVGSGIWTPMGVYTGCSAGWFVNDTDVTIDIQVLSMSEIVVGNSNNYDAMARELAFRTSSGNQCSTGYLGQIPLH